MWAATDGFHDVRLVSSDDTGTPTLIAVTSSSASFPRGTTLISCAIILLAMAEMMHLQHARRPLGDLETAASAIGHRAFEIMFAFPVLGVIAIRVIEIFTISQSIVLKICLVTISLIPGKMLTMALYLSHRVRNQWMSNSRWEEGSEVEFEPLLEQTGLREGRFTLSQARIRSTCYHAICH
ncbi:hypothetical protein J3A83DRAFT_4236636, partial [Scleroderma citrinum]